MAFLEFWHTFLLPQFCMQRKEVTLTRHYHLHVLSTLCLSDFANQTSSSKHGRHKFRVQVKLGRNDHPEVMS